MLPKLWGLTKATVVQISEAERKYYNRIFTKFDHNGNNDNLIEAAELLEIFNYFDSKVFGGRARRNATLDYCARCV